MGIIQGDLQAQLIDHTALFRNISSSKYFRFHYDNDFFTKTDDYYTQGITFEYVIPSIKRFPVSRLLVKLQNSDPDYGFALNLIGYTPTSILSETVLYGDRPYASAITLKTFNTGSDTIHKMRLSSAVSLGVLGPAALGKEIQAGIHRLLDNPIPKGWATQVQNDIILNYEVSMDKAIISSNHFLLNICGEARVGTLNDRISIGFNFLSGEYNNPYRTTQKKKLEYYFYRQVRSHLVGYDATLQGGLFKRNNPYVIFNDDIERPVLQADAGIVVNYKKLLLLYTQSILTREFNTGHFHRWGGISIGFIL